MRFLSLLILVSFLSCKGEVKVVRLESPMQKFYAETGVQPNGELIYQFYHKYGSTDIVERMITISAIEDSINLKQVMPIDSSTLASTRTIDYARFLPEENIGIHQNYLQNKDASIVAYEFGLPPDVMIVQEGSYEVKKGDQSEYLRIIDASKKLEYLEYVRFDKK